LRALLQATAEGAVSSVDMTSRGISGRCQPGVRNEALGIGKAVDITYLRENQQGCVVPDIRKRAEPIDDESTPRLGISEPGRPWI
jgi:hypothetical protein